jgi:hypothetical protein
MDVLAWSNLRVHRELSRVTYMANDEHKAANPENWPHQAARSHNVNNYSPSLLIRDLGLRYPIVTITPQAHLM